MITIVEKWLDRCLPAVEATPISGGAMLPSEMLLFVALCHEQKTNLVVESGRKNGFSTEIICRAGDWEVHSVETSPISAADQRLMSMFPKQLALHRGQGQQAVPRLIDGERRTAILLDGPKNLGACRIFPGLRPHIVFAGIHDVAPLNCNDTSQLNEGRTVASELDPTAYFTDSQDYLDKFGYLDRRWMNSNKDPAGRYASHSAFIKVTCVLGIFKGAKWND